MEKLYHWSDCGGGLESVFTHQDVLDSVTAYWVTGSIGTSFSPYAHRAAPGPLTAPAAFTMFPGDIVNARSGTQDQVLRSCPVARGR